MQAVRFVPEVCKVCAGASAGEGKFTLRIGSSGKREAGGSSGTANAGMTIERKRAGNGPVQVALKLDKDFLRPAGKEALAIVVDCNRPDNLHAGLQHNRHAIEDNCRSDASLSVAG